MRRLVIAEPAEIDLEAIADYIALNDPGAVENVYLRIVEAAKRLPEFPALGRLGRVADTREFSVSDLPYLIVYTVDTEVVTVLAIFHTSRNLAAIMRDRIDDR